MNYSYSKQARIESVIHKVLLTLSRKVTKAKVCQPHDDVKYLEIKSKKKDAPYIVLVHGFGDAPESFSLYTQKLRSKYNIILPYLPGFNNHCVSELTTYDLNYFQESISKILDHLGIKKANFFGHSLGGAVCFKLHESRPDLFQSLTLMDSLAVQVSGVRSIINMVDEGDNPFLVKSKSDYLKFKQQNFMNTKAVPFFIDTWVMENFFSHHWLFKKISEDLFIDADDFEETDSLFDLGAINVPVNIIWGRHDAFFPIEHAQYLKEEIKNSKLHIIDNSGHCPHLERPGSLLKVLGEIYS